MVVLVMVIPYVLFHAANHGIFHLAGAFSPLALLISAGDVAYTGSPKYYWSSLVAVQMLAWALVTGAGLRLRLATREEVGLLLFAWRRVRSWLGGTASRDESQTAEVGRVRPGASAADPTQSGPPSTDAARRDGHALPSDEPNERPPSTSKRDRAIGLLSWQPTRAEATPVEWLVYRQYGLNAFIWTMAVVGLACSGWVPLAQHPIGLLGASSSLWLSWPLGTAAGFVGAAIVAWVASRFFVAGRRTGELECLLTTPVGAETAVPEQWKVLRRLFPWPVLVMQAPMLPQVLTALDPRSGNWPAHSLVVTLLSLANTFFGTVALCWLSLWFGLRTSGQAGAIVRTVAVGKGVPCLVGLLCSALGAALPGSSGPSPGYLVVFVVLSLVPEIGMLFYYLWLIRLARQRLTGELAGVEPTVLNWRQDIVQAVRELTDQIRKTAA
jgi:hypothetical protein